MFPNVSQIKSGFLTQSDTPYRTSTWNRYIGRSHNIHNYFLGNGEFVLYAAYNMFLPRISIGLDRSYQIGPTVKVNNIFEKFARPKF